MLNLEPLRARIYAGLSRQSSSAGRIERRRGAMGSKPVLEGTRIPVDTVRRYLRAGRTPMHIMEAFPQLTEADISAVRASA